MKNASRAGLLTLVILLSGSACGRAPNAEISQDHPSPQTATDACIHREWIRISPEFRSLPWLDQAAEMSRIAGSCNANEQQLLKIIPRNP